MNRQAGLLAALALVGLALPEAAAAQAVAARPAEARYRLVVFLDGDEPMAGQGTFIDDGDIEREGDLRTFSSVQAFTAPPTSPELSGVAYLRVRMRVNCAARTLETLRFTGLAEDGRIVRDGPASNPRVIQASPGSSAAALADYVCEGRLDAAMERVRPLTLRELLDASRRIRERSSGPANR